MVQARLGASGVDSSRTELRRADDSRGCIDPSLPGFAVERPAMVVVRFKEPPLSRLDSTSYGLDLLPSSGPTSPSWRLVTTAELNRERIAKAVLYLAATMQFCGFRSVIGTKWAIADTDRRDLDGNSYD
jgi:hypothetical protein